MWFPLLVGLSSVAVGALVALAPGADKRRLGPFHSFALLSSVAVVLGQLLPDALASLGLPALLVFGASFAAPRALEWLRQHVLGGAEAAPHLEGEEAGPCSDLGLELGYGAFLLHSAADGVGLSVLGIHETHAHYDVILAIAAHTVPVTAMVIMAFKVRNGLRSALTRSLGVLLATGLGMALPAAVSPELLHHVEPWLSAAAAGLLLHVVSHGWAPDGPPTLLGHVMDFVSLVAAGALFLFGRGEHHHHAGAAHDLPEFRETLVHALWDLGLSTAPVLVVGLAVAAAVQVQGARLNSHFPSATLGTGAQALRGASLGLPLPVCACGILPVAYSLRMRGAAPAFVVAFLLSTPELGVDTFALTGRFLGWPLASIRLALALLIAMVGGYLVASQIRAEPQPPLRSAAVVQHRAHRDWLAEALHHFDDLLYHIGAWTLVGLLGAAYLEAVLEAGALEGLAHDGLDVVVVTLIAIPTYICASSATLLGAVLLSKGLSAGAVLVGLLLGPTVNLGTLVFLRASYGFRAVSVGFLGLVGSAWAAAWAVNRFLPPSLAAPSVPVRSEEHGPLAYLSAVLLLALVARAVWRHGLRTWLSTLGEVKVQDDDGSLADFPHHHHHHHGHAHGHAHTHEDPLSASQK